MNYFFLTALIGIVLVGGFIGSMMSGGSIIVFTVLTFLDIQPKIAIGTLKIVITVLGLFSAFTFLKGGAVNLELTPSLTLTSLLGSALGAQLIVSLSNQIVNMLVLLLIILGVFASLRSEKKRKSKKSEAVRNRNVLPIISGLLIGLYIGMLGIASAMITISVLMFLFNLDILQANGTAKMIIFTNNLIASIIYMLNGQVDFILGALFSVPIALGSLLGAKTALKMESSKLRFVFILMAVLTIAKLVSEII
jgi:uncharacterized membrane protein YfcA